MPADDNIQDTTSLGGAPKDGAFADNDVNDVTDEITAEIADRVETVDERLGDITNRVSEKIKACENILVALSRDPSVDEISAALGLTMILNKIGKHATAIYSGKTPNTIEFLKPEETFEKDTNSLQDFIIALDKEKADHLQYKVEGDFVKIYITPYKTTISEKDLEFSQGDFNVDLVISIDVESAEVLDNALEEYGRIMHDATAINITTNQAGHFAEMEWSDPSKSSVCEMVTLLAEKLGYTEFEQPVATALLTGIVAATDHFSNARTTSDTMSLSSKLMEAGADQQLISSNITKPEEPEEKPEEPVEEEKPAEEPAEEAPLEPLIPEPSLEVPAALENLAQPANVGMPESLANELANATPEPAPEPTPAPAPEAPAAPAPAPEAPAAPAEPEVLVGTPPENAPAGAPSIEPAGPEGIPAPTSVTPDPVQSSTFNLPGQTSQDDVQAAMDSILNPSALSAEEPKEELPQIVSQGSAIPQNTAEPLQQAPDYGAMIDQALTEAMQQDSTTNPAAVSAPAVPAQAPAAETIPNMSFDPNATPANLMNPEPAPASEPAAPTPETPAAPAVPATPEAAPAPVEIPTDSSILPPPPAPAIDLNTMPPVVAEAPAPAVPAAPAAPAPAEAPESAPNLSDPSAFQIPQA